MVEFFLKLTVLDKIFVVSAVLGGLVVIIRLILQFVGGDADADMGDIDVDMDVDVDVADGSMDTGDAGISLLSLQGLSGFMLMFGLVGLALHRQTEVASYWSIAGGFAAGLLMMWILARLMMFFKKLQSSGTLNLQNALGKEGQVYLTIPSRGLGKAQVVVQGRLKVLEARAQDDEAIKTGERVKVAKLVSGNVLVVKKI